MMGHDGGLGARPWRRPFGSAGAADCRRTVPSRTILPAGGSLETMTRADLHRLVDELPDPAVEPVARLLTSARELLEVDDEPITAEEAADVKLALVESRRGEGINLEDFRAELAAAD